MVARKFEIIETFYKEIAFMFYVSSIIKFVVAEFDV